MWQRRLAQLVCQFAPKTRKFSQPISAPLYRLACTSQVDFRAQITSKLGIASIYNNIRPPTFVSTGIKPFRKARSSRSVFRPSSPSSRFLSRSKLSNRHKSSFTIILDRNPQFYYARRSYTSDSKESPNSEKQSLPSSQQPSSIPPQVASSTPNISSESIDAIKPVKPEPYGTILWSKMKRLPFVISQFIGLHGPLTLDKILPFFNLMFVGIGAGILLATTTVVSLGVWIVNRNEHWQELTAKKVGAYLTYQTGINIEYEGVTAAWREGTLTLKNVKVYRDPFSFAPGVDRNVTAFHFDIERLTVSVSLLWLVQGNGILKHLSASGVTGFIDQRHLDWSGPPLPPRVWRRGDFFLDCFQLSNVHVSLFNGAPDRELKIQIHSIDCEQLRKQWLLHDILSAKSAYGIFDGSLFSLTRLPKRYAEDQDVRSTLKIDGVNSDLISAASAGPISWITEGTIDIDMDLNFKSDFYEQGWHYHLDANTQTGYYSQDSHHEIDPLVLNVKLKLNNLRASIPVTTDQLSIINKALVLPVVAYMNTNYTSIPLNFEVLLPRQNFDGSWSPWEAGLFDAISVGVAQEFVSLVKQQQSSTNIQRHLLMVIKSLHRGIYFLRQQIQGYYSLWYFNNDEHPDDMYAA